MKELNIIIATALGLWVATANAQIDLQAETRQIDPAQDTEDVSQSATPQIKPTTGNDSFSRATTLSKDDKEKLNKQITDYKKNK